MKVSNAETFTADSQWWGTFSYSLSDLSAGKYEVKAIAYDREGATSKTVLRSFTVKEATVTPTPRPTPTTTPTPTPTPIRILPLYTKDEKISFSGAKVFDTEGVSDISKVDFWFQKEGGEKIEIAKDVTEFTSDSDGFCRFNFSDNLSSLAPGRYQLSAIAYDKAGSGSPVTSEKFALISDPGADGLSDEVRLAIVGAENLDSYPPEALAETKEWVVWVTPGQSS